MAIAFWNPSRLSVAATSASAAFSCAGVMSPSLRPFRSVAPTCIVMPVGRFDQTVRVFSFRSMLALRRWPWSSVARNASAAATARPSRRLQVPCAAARDTPIVAKTRMIASRTLEGRLTFLTPLEKGLRGAEYVTEALAPGGVQTKARCDIYSGL